MFSCRMNSDTELRFLETRQAGELYAVVDRNREHLRRWLPWVDGTVGEEAIADFIRSTLGQLANENGLHAGIFYKGRIAGCIGFHGIDWQNRKTSIGYWLAKEYEGQGIMTGACRVMIGHAFKEWDLNRVEIRAAVSNLRSRAVPERLGFTQEGIIRQAERLSSGYADHVVYGLLREEWDGTMVREGGVQ
jgi:ribosomal-protein-serine acetyltransferase